MWSSLGSRLRQVPWREAAAEPLHCFSLVVKGLCLYQVISSRVCGVTIMMGPSMLPTFNLTGDMVAVNKVVTWCGQLNKGDVVEMLSPDNPRKHIVKRILGVEGDTVTYLVNPANSDTSKTVVVPKGHIWVQGDNIHASNDSRKFGPVPRGLVQGKLVCRISNVKGDVFLFMQKLPTKKKEFTFGFASMPRGKVWPPEHIGLIDSKVNTEPSAN